MTSTHSCAALTPEFLVRNLQASLDFYVSILGFHVEYERPENKFAMLSLGAAWLMLEETDGTDAVTEHEFVNEREWRTGELEYPFGRGVNFQIIVTDVKRVYEDVVRSSCAIKVPIEERWYRAGEVETGSLQFLVLDPDGYLLRLQQRIGIRDK